MGKYSSKTSLSSIAAPPEQHSKSTLALKDIPIERTIFCKPGTALTIFYCNIWNSYNSTLRAKTPES